MSNLDRFEEYPAWLVKQENRWKEETCATCRHCLPVGCSRDGTLTPDIHVCVQSTPPEIFAVATDEKACEHWEER